MTLLELFGLLRKNLLLVILLPIIAGVGVYIGSLFLPNEYTASTTMYVLSRDDDPTKTSDITQSDLSASQMLTSDVATIMKSDRVERDVAEQFGLTNLKGYKLNVTNSTTTRVLSLAVTGRDPQMAADIANAVVADTSKVAQDVMRIQSVNAIDSAIPPANPSGPRRLLYAAVGALAGFFLAVAIVVLRDMLDTRVRSGSEAEEIVGVPVVGHFPAIGA